MNVKQIGNASEEKVCEYLLSNGYDICQRNFRCPSGEIDIIAVKNQKLHFVEVKHLSPKWDTYDIVFKVNDAKQKKIKKAANTYLVQDSDKKYYTTVFDVACVVNNEVKYWEGAF